MRKRMTALLVTLMLVMTMFAASPAYAEEKVLTFGCQM